jgi:predicted RNA-binding protein YlxR (DUF448 family)
MKTRKIPMRTCLGCNEQKTKKELIRVVKMKDGEISVDMTGKMNGRGAYICPDLECLKKARKKKSIDRSLSVPISEEIYDRLEEELKNGK